MSNIRITYTGFIAFFVSLIGIITGTAFTLILTRSLTQEEYGTWGLISGLIAYVMIINLIVSYWNTREIARKIESGRTAIVGTMVLSIGAIMIYVIMSIVMSKQTNIDPDTIIFALILIPPMFLNGILSAINLGWKPHVISYATLAHGIVQVPFALLFVHYFDYGIEGVIFASFIANSISIIILFKYAKPKLKNNLRLFFFKSWLRLSWVPLYPGLFIVIDTLGIVVFSAITGSVLGIAIWAAANVSPGIIKSVQTISRAVYPKLLEGGKKSYLEDNFAHLFYFNFMMTGIVIIFAKPALFALNPIYQEAYLVVVFLALRNFFFVLTNVFILNLGGNETVDINENESSSSDPINVELLSLEELLGAPELFSVHQNYPNPFNPITTFRYDLPENTHVQIIIYDMIGRKVKTLVDQFQDSGYKYAVWDATNDYGKPVSGGIYLYQVNVGSNISTKKMVLLK